MKLIKCYIENFGILTEKEISFSKGLNCAVSENGTGKTTLTAFIEAMLYGIGDTRKQSLEENPRKKYSPWQGGKFGGSLTVEVGKKRYVIERSFGARPADDTFRLVDADTGNESGDYAENIGESLFGIDRDGFLRTVFLSERNLQGKNDNKTISAKLSDLVGVDGDVGGIDDALKLLEERRKFYFKKGNTGEIANVRERINECQRKLDNLERLEEEVRNKEARYTEIARELRSIDEGERSAHARLEEHKALKEKAQLEERYAQMLTELNKERAKLNEIKTFFREGVPTTTQVDSMRDIYVEAGRLKSEAMAQEGNEEYLALAECFKNGTSFSEISDMEKAAERIEELKKECEALDGGYDPTTAEMRKIFPDQAPTSDDMERMEKAAKSSGGFLRALLLLVGLCAAAGGALIGGTIGYAIAGVGLLVALTSVFFLRKSKKSKEMLALARKFNGCECSNLSGIIDELKKKLERYEELEKARAERRDLITEESTRLTLTLGVFLSKFPLTDAATMLEAVRIIRNRYTQYYALTKTGAMGDGGKIEKLERSNSLMKTARDFLAKYPTVTEYPFAEIRDRISDLNYATVSVTRVESECDAFAARYGVLGKPVVADPTLEMGANEAIAQLSERKKALTEEQTLISREISIYRAETEKKDEYLMAKEELDELLLKHIDSLDTIKRTAAFLSQACDNITSKYLGKTKERFEEYSRFITGTDGEYTLNTSFELTKTERGASHGIESYSRGTRDLYALALRLALLDALYENESPFIILDDPFVALDDKRLEKAKAMLKTLGKTKQILYFTCTKARAVD